MAHSMIPPPPRASRRWEYIGSAVLFAVLVLVLFVWKDGCSIWPAPWTGPRPDAPAKP